MTRSGVGRSLRTASRQAYAPPVGRPFGMPGIQPAAGQITVRTDRTLVRVGLRALVVAGFAGAAWLLSANAAQAADAPVTDRTTGPSVVRLLPEPGADGVPPNGAGLTTLLPSSIHAVAPARQPALGTVMAVLAGAVASESSATSVVLPGTLHRAEGPDHGHAALAGAPVIGTITSVTASLDDLLRQVPVVPRSDAGPGGLASVPPISIAPPAWPAADERPSAVFRSARAVPQAPIRSVTSVAHGVPTRDGPRAEAVTAAPVDHHRSVTAAG